MGTLFHIATRETGLELQLMKELGYDGVAIGNHEFDFRPDGLAQMIRSAQAGRGVPPILAANLIFDSQDPRDDGLKALVDDATIMPTRMVERDGLSFGLIGVLGTDAYDKIGQAAPVRIADPTATIRAAAGELRGAGADVVVLLSHSGVLRKDGEYVGWEVDYARDIPELDLIVGGHSHTPIHEPPVIDGCPVLQAGSDGRFLGEARFARSADGWSMVSSALLPVDDRIPGDPEVTALIDSVQEHISTSLLAPLGYRFDEPIAEVDRDLTRRFDDHVLGNLLTDGYRQAVGADVGFTGNGSIRADVVRGRTGVQRVSDLFRVDSLGIGTHDDRPGYGLMKIWFTGPDLKSVLEFLLVGYQIKGPDYYPRISGVQVETNPYRVPMDRITRISLGDDGSGYRPADLSADKLYSVATTTYVGGFLPTVSEATFGLLDATPRDADGRPVDDMDTLVYDRDPATPEIDEIKAWQVLLETVRALPDTDGDGLANIPSTGPPSEERWLATPSLAPGALTRNATWRQWTALGVPFALITGILIGGGWMVRRVRRRSEA